MTTDREMGRASGTGPSTSATAAVCALLVAAVLTGAALAAPGSGLGVRTEGPATAAVGAAATVDPAGSIAPEARHPGGSGDAKRGRAHARCGRPHRPRTQRVMTHITGTRPPSPASQHT
ncbi:hypothetical protein ACWGMA_06905 [Streptomyces asiaticus]